MCFLTGVPLLGYGKPLDEYLVIFSAGFLAYYGLMHAEWFYDSVFKSNALIALISIYRSWMQHKETLGHKLYVAIPPFIRVFIADYLLSIEDERNEESEEEKEEAPEFSRYVIDQDKFQSLSESRVLQTSAGSFPSRADSTATELPSREGDQVERDILISPYPESRSGYGQDLHRQHALAKRNVKQGSDSHIAESLSSGSPWTEGTGTTMTHITASQISS